MPPPPGRCQNAKSRLTWHQGVRDERTTQMNDTAFAIGSKFLELYAGGPSKVVVELGAYAVNGSLRASCPPNACYIGLDLEHGPSVDVVVKAREPLPIRTGFADVVISSSQMEHDPLFWQSFLELVRITKPGGAIYMSAPSNGFYHTYPADCWRFYPDAGRLSPIGPARAATTSP